MSQRLEACTRYFGEAILERVCYVSELKFFEEVPYVRFVFVIRFV